MPTKTQNKTQPTKVTPDSFILSQGFTPAEQEDARTLVALFEQVTGEKCVMWGKIFGFGLYRYRSKSREGDWMKTGFAMRKGAISIYIMCGLSYQEAHLRQLGKHTTSGGSCLYVKKLADIDLKVLEKIIIAGLHDLEHSPTYKSV